MGRVEDFTTGHGDGHGHPERIKPLKTADDYYNHMVEYHGHDDMSDNPGLKSWGVTEWKEQHDEDHEDGDYYDDEHVH